MHHYLNIYIYPPTVCVSLILDPKLSLYKTQCKEIPSGKFI